MARGFDGFKTKRWVGILITSLLDVEALKLNLSTLLLLCTTLCTKVNGYKVSIQRVSTVFDMICYQLMLSNLLVALEMDGQDERSHLTF